MKVAVSSQGGQGLDSAVDSHFGRCPSFVVVDLEGCDPVEVQEVPNPFAASHEPGQVPQFMASQGVEVMISGGMGRRALVIFEELGIQAVTGASGSVRDAVAAYLDGNLQGGEPCIESVQHTDPA